MYFIFEIRLNEVNEEFLMYKILAMGTVVTARAFCTHASLIKLND